MRNGAMHDPYQTAIRLEGDLRQALHEAAERNGRNLSQEIRARLWASLVDGRPTMNVDDAMAAVRYVRAWEE